MELAERRPAPQDKFLGSVTQLDIASESNRIPVGIPASRLMSGLTESSTILGLVSDAPAQPWWAMPRSEGINRGQLNGAQ